MAQTLRTLIRGPGALLLALAIATGLTLAGNAISRAESKSTPGPRYFLTASGSAVAVDPHTGVSLRLDGTGTQIPESGTSAHGGRMALTLTVFLHNGGRRVVRYRVADFVLEDAAGSAFVASPAPGVKAWSGRLAPGKSANGKLIFDVYSAADTYYVVWSDEGRLAPPALLERISVRPVVS